MLQRTDLIQDDLKKIKKYINTSTSISFFQLLFFSIFLFILGIFHNKQWAFFCFWFFLFPFFAIIGYYSKNLALKDDEQDKTKYVGHISIEKKYKTRHHFYLHFSNSITISVNMELFDISDIGDVYYIEFPKNFNLILILQSDKLSENDWFRFPNSGGYHLISGLPTL